MIEVSGTQIKVMNAAGTLGKEAIASQVESLDALVTKTVTAEPMVGNPPPRIAEAPSGIVNSVGLQNPGIERFLDKDLGVWASYGLPVIVSVGHPGGRGTLGTYRALGEDDRVAGVEVNLSCPNIENHSSNYLDSDANMMSHIRAALGDKPVWLKLSALDARERVERLGNAWYLPDAITLINTIPALVINEGKPLLGGLSGPAIKPIALRAIYEISRLTSIPIIGCGGIRTERDIEEYMMVGASAVQVGCSSFIS